jgi:Tol biopolymer transport system component
LAALLVTVGAAWWLSRAKAIAPASAPTLVRLTSDSGLTTDPALSPDGKLLAYASDRSGDGNLDIWVQQVSGGEAIRLTRDPADDSEPVFSPDGSKIAFRSDRDGGGVYVMSALGGEARRIARQGRRPRFSPDGSLIVYSVGPLTYTGMYVVPSEGGPPRQVQPGFTTAREAVWSPDGKHLLFAGQFGAKRDWWVTPLDGGPAVQTGAIGVFQQHGLPGEFSILAGSGFPELWLPGTDEVVFPAFSVDSLNLWQVSISAKTWRASGAPRRLMSGAGMEARPSVAAGRLVFTALSQSTNVWGLPIDANSGKVLGDIGQLTEGAARDTNPSLSNDGKKLVFFRSARHTSDIWLKDVQSGQERRLASNVLSAGLLMAGDGSKVVYSNLEDQKRLLYSLSTSGGEPVQICRQDCGGAMGSLSRDGGKILWETSGARSVVMLDFASSQRAEILKHPQQGGSMGRFSPDDRWVAFHTISSPATRQIFVAPFRGTLPIPKSEWIPITDGQAIDRYTWWSPDGNLLYFISERDGFVCLWAQRLDPATKHPKGAAFPIRHFHTARRSLATIGNPGFMGMSVGTGQLIFSMTEQTGNIWMTELALPK